METGPVPLRHSYTRLSSYIRCPKAYEFQYIQKIPSPKSGPALLGGVCHDFFEAYDRHLISVQQSTDHAAAEQIMLDVLQKFERPVPPELYEQYLELCRDFVQNHILDLKSVVGVELQIAITRALSLCDWMAEEAWFRFKLDRLDVKFGEGRAIITDYKTGWGGDADPFQLLLYACAVWIYHHQVGQWVRSDGVPLAAVEKLKAVEVVLYYNRSGRDPRWVFTPETIERGIEQMIQYAERVESEKVFKATPGPVCTSCDYAGPDLCPYKAAKLTPLRFEVDAIQAASESLVMKAQASAREEALRLWVSKNGPVQVRGAVFDFGTRESYKVIDPVGFVNAVKEAGLDPIEFYEINTTKLKRLCQKDANLADHVAPFIAVETTETFGHKAAPKMDPFASSSQTQGENHATQETNHNGDHNAGNEKPGADAIQGAIDLQAPTPGIARFFRGDDPRTGDRGDDRETAAPADNDGTTRCRQARGAQPGSSAMGEQPAAAEGSGSGGCRRRPF